MYWLQRPPYLRWAAAAALVVTALVWDLRPSPTELRPFAAADVAAGDAVAVEWRAIPAGMLPDVEPEGRVAAVDLHAGDPVVPAVLTELPRPPEGWLTLPLASAGHALPGQRVLLILPDPAGTHLGVVVAGPSGDRYGFDAVPTLVAVAPEAAAAVAEAERSGALTVAVEG